MKVSLGKNAFMVNKVDEMVERRGGTKRLEELQSGAKPSMGRWAALKGEQHASTKANLERQEKGEHRDWDAPIEGWKAERDAEKVFAELNKVSPSDLSHAESVRKTPRNQDGQSEQSATTPERRASAVHHFEVAGNVKATDVDPTKIVGLEPIKSALPPKEVWIEIPWYKALWHKLRGGKIRSEKK